MYLALSTHGVRIRLFAETLQAAGVADRHLLQRVTDSGHFKRQKGSRSLRIGTHGRARSRGTAWLTSWLTRVPCSPRTVPGRGAGPAAGRRSASGNGKSRTHSVFGAMITDYIWLGATQAVLLFLGHWQRL